MATVACPGCGLPRAESGPETPCPVCAAAPVVPGAAPPRRSKPAAPEPTDGLPADASELGAHRAEPRQAGSRALLLCVVMFVFGALAGVGGVLGWQSLERAKPADEPEVAVKPDEPPAPQPLRPAVAPMPHEPIAEPADPDPTPEPEPEPKPLQPPPPLGRVTTIEVNEPDANYSLPFTMKKGEHVVLKGKVKALKVSVLDEGAILDAAGLEAATVYVSGKIDNRSTLKLNAPGGTVHVGGKVEGKSVVEINAPGGEVKFLYVTTGTKEGSKIDTGSTVSITARVVEFKGDISGDGTKVSVVLTRNGWLKVASVSGKATAEYKSQAAGWSPPDVTVGPVAPTATFRKRE